MPNPRCEIEVIRLNTQNGKTQNADPKVKVGKVQEIGKKGGIPTRVNLPTIPTVEVISGTYASNGQK